MKASFRFAGLLIVTLAALVAVFSPGSSRGVDAAGGAKVNCSIPNNVVCDISSPFGIKHVTVTLHTSKGDVKVVDKAYRCDGAVQVSWDPIVPFSTMKVDTCDSLSATNDIATVDNQGQPGTTRTAMKKVLFGAAGVTGGLITPGPTLQKHTWGCGPATGSPFLPCGVLQSFCAAIGGNYDPYESPVPSPEPEEPSGHCETPEWPPEPQEPGHP